MKLTPFCLVICVTCAITCLTSPANSRPHPEYVSSRTHLSKRSGSGSGSALDSGSASDSGSTSDMESASASHSSTEDSNGEFDECSSSPCQNGGTCIDATNDYNCMCVDGYLGRNCEEFDECSSSPCQNGGTCIDATNDYNCMCKEGYLGRNCEDFDECSSSPCQNGGTCVDATNDYNCTCVDRYLGRNCEEFDECSSSPCQNGGTCVDATNDYNCTCVDNRYFGKNCEEVQPCLQGWLFNNGSCYYFSETQRAWAQARVACLSLSMNDGHLVDIHSQAEQDFLKSQLIANSVKVFWIGLNDIANEGEFVWVDTNRDVSFTYWSPYFKPSEDYEDCVYIYYSLDVDPGLSLDGWNEYYCTDYSRYICEMEAIFI